MTEPRAYLRDMRAAKVCAGSRVLFFERYGLDWQDFKRNGIPVSKLDATGNAIAIGVANIAREREAREASDG